MAHGSTLPRRALGRQLRKLRERAGFTLSAAARVAEISPQSYGRIEDGRQTKVTDLGLNALANAYEDTDEERRLLLDLAREIRATTTAGGGRWRAYEDAISSGFDHYLSLEEAASWETNWQTTVIPGLLQTREYRRAMDWSLNPHKPTEEIERSLDVTVRRQTLLDRKSFRAAHPSGLQAIRAAVLMAWARRSSEPVGARRLMGRRVAISPGPGKPTTLGLGSPTILSSVSVRWKRISIWTFALLVNRRSPCTHGRHARTAEVSAPGRAEA